MFAMLVLLNVEDIIASATGCFFVTFILLSLHLRVGKPSKAKELDGEEAQTQLDDEEAEVLVERPVLMTLSSFALRRRQDTSLSEGLALLEQYGVFGAESGSWQFREAKAHAQAEQPLP
mmetsp:Transcript_43022/g.93683  ORF Transcript_43022/g.93683 Transcript_43022/m.93683 type:complete len:119 (+) Transcript_43022:158-514(+)